MTRQLVWLRDDLRLHDNPALFYAAAQGPVLCVYVVDTHIQPAMGAASLWWLHHSLQAFAAQLSAVGGRLLVLQGNSQNVLLDVVKRHNIAQVHWNRRYHAAAISADTALKTALKQQGVAVQSYAGNLLLEPWHVQTGSGQPFKVFTPFWRQCSTLLALTPPALLPAPERMETFVCVHDAFDTSCFLPTKPNWAKEFPAFWRPGEQAARQKLDTFLTRRAAAYQTNRDFPALQATSRLSPHLRFGEISAREVYVRTDQFQQFEGQQTTGSTCFLSEVGWREFSYHLLHYFPSLPTENWKKNFDAFAWQHNPDHVWAWQQGHTGYPIVDAGLRELWRTGYMHNRVRMIAASFLVKDLLIPWQQGAAWFWDTLLDADLASNSASWQWVAGSGADASPYFRIFNPITQGEKFDPDGTYVRQWVPELAQLPASVIHKPWQASAFDLLAAGVQLGETYPHPIVQHDAARARALAAYKAIRG